MKLNNYKSLDELYLKVAKELKISKFLVKEVVQDVFLQTRNSIKNINHPVILLNNLGKFKANKRTVSHLLNKRKTYNGLTKQDWETFYNKILELDKDE